MQINLSWDMLTLTCFMVNKSSKSSESLLTVTNSVKTAWLDLKLIWFAWVLRNNTGKLFLTGFKGSTKNECWGSKGKKLSQACRLPQAFHCNSLHVLKFLCVNIILFHNSLWCKIYSNSLSFFPHESHLTSECIFDNSSPETSAIPSTKLRM